MYYQEKFFNRAIISCLSCVLKLCGHVQICPKFFHFICPVPHRHQCKQVPDTQTHTPTTDVMDSIHFWYFSFIFQQRDREKKTCSTSTVLTWSYKHQPVLLPFEWECSGMYLTQIDRAWSDLSGWLAFTRCKGWLWLRRIARDLFVSLYH